MYCIYHSQSNSVVKDFIRSPSNNFFVAYAIISVYLNFFYLLQVKFMRSVYSTVLVPTFCMSIPVSRINLKKKNILFTYFIWFIPKLHALYSHFFSSLLLSIPFCSYEKITSRAARLFFIPVQIILLANKSSQHTRWFQFQSCFVWLTATPATYQQTHSQVHRIRPKGTHPHHSSIPASQHPSININALRCRSPIILSIFKSFFIPTFSRLPFLLRPFYAVVPRRDPCRKYLWNEMNTLAFPALLWLMPTDDGQWGADELGTPDRAGWMAEPFGITLEELNQSTGIV